MRKNIIALMLVLPLLFVFIVFSSGNVASLGVSVSASGIQIMNAPEDDTLRIDLVDYDNDFVVEAQVFPENASNKEYSFRVEEVEGTELADITVSEEGRIGASSVGTARVVAVSKDGAYTDSITVIVSSSKPYGMNVSLYSAAGEETSLEETESGYSATVVTGLYRYEAALIPGGFSRVTAKTESGFAVVDEEAGTLLLPFGGEATVCFSVENGVSGSIERRIAFTAVQQQTASGITVNGGAETILTVEEQSLRAEFFVQAESEPTVVPNDNLLDFEVQKAEGAGEDCYKISLTFADDHLSEFEVAIRAGDAEDSVLISFREFAFTVRSTLPVQGEDTVMLVGSEVVFSAVPSVVSEGITYLFEVEAGTLSSEEIDAVTAENGLSCGITAGGAGTFTLVVTPYRGSVALNVRPVEIDVEVVRAVTSVQIVNETAVGLAGRTAVAGRTFDENAALQTYAYELVVKTYNNMQEADALADFDIGISDSSLAEVTVQEDKVFLHVKGTGEVTVSFTWKANGSFGQNIGTAVTFDVVKDGVFCDTSDEVFLAAKQGLPIVLGADVMLGTQDDGTPYPLSARRNMLGEMKSTYNIEYYKNTNREAEAKVKYVIEFKNDVYGNGHSLNAEYFTNAQDATGTPQLYFGPLYFVSYGQLASVAAQDNISYLVRTDGVTLHNVSLYGCSDESLYEDDQYKLENLNNVGTVLEVNADTQILNCRVRNGRTVVRVYGGNRSGDQYFIDSLAQNKGCDEERIEVRIEGCILSQAREFILKIGANRALRANDSISSDPEKCCEPDLLDKNGNPYAVQTNDYLNDDYFYEQYVMTDVTLKDSVLETSGLFAVGVESNFSGVVLYQNSSSSGMNFEGWPGTGGTSFASVLRMESDVRIYDWKRLDLIDSSTLIESALPEFQLDIAGMLNYACSKEPEKYGDLIAEYDGEQVVHGGIALYGGGKNYAQISMDGLETSLREDYGSGYRVNLSILDGADDEGMAHQGAYLVAAAGTQDFRFYMFGKNSVNSYEKQLADEDAGIKYDGIGRLSAFGR